MNTTFGIYIRFTASKNYHNRKITDKKEVEVENMKLHFLAQLFDCLIPSWPKTLQTLYLECADLASLERFKHRNMKSLLFTSSVRTATFVSTVTYKKYGETDLHMKFVTDKKVLDFHAKNNGFYFWKLVTERPVSFKSLTEVKFSQRPRDFFDPFACKGLVDTDLINICLFSKLKEVDLDFSGFISPFSFMKVSELEEIKLLVLRMKYCFERLQLIEVLEKSKASNLEVKIIEYLNRGENETITLNRGSISVSFIRYEHK